MWEKLFAGPLAILYWGVALWGFFLTSGYIHDHFGFLGVIIALFILPVAYGVTPIIAGVADGYWLPALVSYSPMAVMLALSVLAGIGSAFARR